MGFDDREIVALSGAHTIGRAFAERSGTVSEGYGPKKGSVYTKPTHIARGDGKKGIGMAGGRSWTKQWLTFDNSCAPRIPAPTRLLYPPTLPGAARQLPPSAEIHRPVVSWQVLHGHGGCFVRGRRRRHADAADGQVAHRGRRVQEDLRRIPGPGANENSRTLQTNFAQASSSACKKPWKNGCPACMYLGVRRPCCALSVDCVGCQDKFFEAYASAHAKPSELGSKFEPAGGITID